MTCRPHTTTWMPCDKREKIPPRGADMAEVTRVNLIRGTRLPHVNLVRSMRLPRRISGLPADHATWHDLSHPSSLRRMDGSDFVFPKLGQDLWSSVLLRLDAADLDGRRPIPPVRRVIPYHRSDQYGWISSVAMGIARILKPER